MSFRGIDVSFYQGAPDWAAVRGSGVQFAMLRAGYGFGNADEQFRRNASECNRLGIPFGVYWFSYAYTAEAAKQEADYCIQALQDFEVQYPVAYDFESASVQYANSYGVTVTPALATAIVGAFCSRVEELGYFAMYYSNENFLNNFFESSLRSKYALWYAKYQSSPGLGDLGMWQYASTGSVPGISGNVDLDISYYDYASVISGAGLNKLKGQISTPGGPSPSPGGEITYTIRPGDTLSEIAERYGTTYQALAAYNGIANPNLIYAGQVIRIPSGGSSGGRFYTVQWGDTLSELALRFGTTVAELQRLNGITNPDLIYAGQVIRV